MSKLLIIVLDGCATDYISKENTPNFYRMAKSGFCKSVKSAVPAVNNVNHATIMTGEFPVKHGLFRLKHNDNTFNKTKCENIFQYYNKAGKSTALLTTNPDMLKNFGAGLKFGICTENPNEILVRFLGMAMPPKAKPLEVNLWVLEATLNLIKKNNPDFIYCTTNDFLLENYSPESVEASEYMKKLDAILGKIFDKDPEREIYITSDRGLKRKVHIVDFDSYVKENKELENINYFEVGGLIFVNFNTESVEEQKRVTDCLERYDFVEQVKTRNATIEKFRLPADEIGDITLIPKEGYAFGESYEREIPLIAVNPREVPQKYRFSRDIVNIILDEK